MTQEEYRALTPPEKTVSRELITTLVQKGLILHYPDSSYESGARFELSLLGALSVRAYEAGKR